MEMRLYVWGSGGTGQLGLGTEDDYAIPQLWENDRVQLESVVSGGCHSAGINSIGRLFLWGSNDRGQLGNTTEHKFISAPTESAVCVPRESKAKLVACGWWSTLAVMSSHCGGSQEDRVFSWGSNDHHQLGRDQSSKVTGGKASAQIVHLPPRLQVASIACGWKHSLLATTEGDVYSWGSGRHGQLGLGAEALKSEAPKRIETLKGTAIINVFCGWEHSVFRSSDGDIYTCGNNRHGQLGVRISGSAASERSSERRKQVNALPIQVVDPSNSNISLRTAQVSCGWHFVLCLTDTGKLVTWGKGSHGQLGLGGFDNAYEPQVVPFPHTARHVACGSEHSMVVTTSGDLYTCGWGEHGNLGHGDKTNRASLEKVEFFINNNQKVISIAAGGAVSIAVTNS
ncbi:Regulator of chromosome condensation (RCC1) repeat [Phytophthora infestans]|uniref:Regulator of chromosome condensation (RCC1) repeat n=1 Tax=Phytophthora infestans TaxID=4787 RepID=A0A833W570_PHYIN|nr:Regulator of chromosome condensation (RCC1) repeat [Phytophthora infestans]KAF4128027.1 Regulator of chromosome condensation (RCC1) repeat [Phytophthora infestans]